MALTLTIDLTDQQQAILVQMAPGATNAEKKAWAEDVARKALRREVRILREQSWRATEQARLEAERAAIEADRIAAEAALETDWPES